MAERFEEIREELTCSICRDVVQDPVALRGCQHSFCRTCVQDLIEHPPLATGHGPDGPQCPECRKPIDLDRRGVSDLPANFKLAGVASKVVGDITSDDRKTSRCEKHRKMFYIYCSDCQTLICLGCLGEHDKHSLLDINKEYENRKVLAHAKVKDCEEAKTKLEACMADCREIIKRVESKQARDMKDIQRAYDDGIQSLEHWRKKSEECITTKYMKLNADCNKAIDNLNLKQKEISSMIQSCQDTLSRTAVTFLKGVTEMNARLDTDLPELIRTIRGQEQQNKTWKESLDIANVTRRHLAVMELPSGQVSVEETTPKQLSLIGPHREHTNADDIPWTCLPFNPTAPANLMLTASPNEQRISTPLLKFSWTNSKQQSFIQENGAVFECMDIAPYQNYEAWTDGLMGSECAYWEVTVTIKYNLEQPHSGCFFAGGVAHNGSALGDDPSKASWYVGLVFSQRKVKCYTHGRTSEVKRNYREYDVRRGPHKLGFYLNCRRRTLTVFDRLQDEVMCTVAEVDVSKPLVPAVRFSITFPVPSKMSVRLLTGDRCAVPEILKGIHESSQLQH